MRGSALAVGYAAFRFQARKSLLQGNWKGISAIIKLAEAAKVSEKPRARQWLIKQTHWQIYLSLHYFLRPKFRRIVA